MICDNCGKKTARILRRTIVYGSGKKAFLIERVPEIACKACGQHYFTAKTVRRLEQIRRDWRKLTVVKNVRWVKFGGAA
ncbi:MAG: YgiT-type zinc finger protein [Planctomycetota bacterium]